MDLTLYATHYELVYKLTSNCYFLMVIGLNADDTTVLSRCKL